MRPGLARAGALLLALTLLLGRSAFQDCELGLVTVPAGVTELDMWTFSGASLLNATLEDESTWSYTDREPSGSTAG